MLYKDSDLAKKIERARIGIVFHTKYTGKSIADLSASFGVSVSGFKNTPDVWYDDAYLKDVSGSATLTNKEVAKVDKLIKRINTLLVSNRSFLTQLNKNKSIIDEIKIYINANVRQGVSTGNIGGFVAYMDKKLQSQVDKLKSEAGKKRKQEQKDKIMSFLAQNGAKIDKAFKLHALLGEAKIVLVRKFEKIKSIGTFIKSGDGFEVTAPEGYVAIDRYGTKALKLVDRLEFSRQNFTAAKNWVKG